MTQNTIRSTLGYILTFVISFILTSCQPTDYSPETSSSVTLDNVETPLATPVLTSTPKSTLTPTSTPTPTIEPTPTVTPIGGGGGLIALVSSMYGSLNVFSVDLTTKEETQHSFGAEYVYDPFWSPDGKFIAFTGKVFTENSYYQKQIFIVDISEGKTEQITHESENIAPSWSPDSEDLVFLSSRDGSWAIYTMKMDGSSIKKRTDGLGFVDQPFWSPSGYEVILADRENIISDSDLIKIELGKFGYQNLTNNEAEEFDPAWSPDGTKIAFISDRDGSFEIYIMDSDGSNQTRLTNNGDPENLPHWSPDGSMIAFQSFVNDSWDIFVMGSDGSDLVQITDHPAADLSPVWSPDGSMLAFVTLRDDDQWEQCRDTRDCNSEIYIVALASGEHFRLTENSKADVSPAWQPYLRTPE